MAPALLASSSSPSLALSSCGGSDFGGVQLKKGDTSTHGSHIGPVTAQEFTTENVSAHGSHIGPPVWLDLYDFTWEFTTENVLPSEDILRDWITSTGKENGFVIIIKSSERMAKNRRPRMRFACERGGKYRPFINKAKDKGECRANYLIFKDLDRQGADFFPKRMEQKALNQNNQGRSWMAVDQSKEEKPWLASKRNTSTSPAPPASKREYPPQKRVNIGKEIVTQGDQEVSQEQFSLVKGVPNWFLKKIKPELFQGYKDLSKTGKTYKPPNSLVGQWVLVRDPKTKVPQMVLILTRTQKRKLQRRYTLFQMEEPPPKNKMWRETKPNPRCNKVRKEDSEDLVQKNYQHLEEKTLMEITAATDDDEGDRNLASPNSLASYQSGLLEAMLVEQECRERSSSPMETSAIAGSEAEVKGEGEQEQSCKEMVIQFGSIPKVQINMVQPSSMTFVSPNWSPTPSVSQPNEGPLEIIEISSSEELEAWEEMQGSKEAQMMEGDYDILILTNEIQDNEATLKETATEMYKPEIVPLSELTQAATHPTSEMDSGELVKLKVK
ncbi:hypothetical protein RHGRI_001724 [Rhododendron griersonianum]|uniref:Uncharacterized protein n=1 Tax=Rhododendron griersonianum TaxID=479676 RepID=A0AAV6LL59_9ERIC|nr:hypothetical protein RHGRI_001724 [Rhododendron griersonianum]